MIAVFTETWLDGSIPDEAVSFRGYTTIRKDRNARGGGIACYISSDISVPKFVLRTINSNDVPSMEDCNSELLPIVLPGILLLVVYHPFWSNPSEHESCISCILDIVDFAFSSVLDPCSSKLIVCGDFNDLRHYYKDLSSLLVAEPIVHFPTRCDNTLDQIFTNFKTTSKPQRLPPIGNSDHLSVMWRQNPESRFTTKVTVRQFSNKAKAMFQAAILDTDWLSLTESQPSLDDAASVFLSTLSDLYNHHFPNRTVRMRSNDPPWMKPSLKLLINRRDSAFSEGKNLKYHRLRHQVITHTKELKSKYLSLVSDQRQSARTWEAIRIIGRLSHRGGQPPALSADEMNNFFASCFNGDNGVSLPSEPHPAPLYTMQSQPLVVSVLEVERILRSSKKRSPGPDGVPSWILKFYASVLSPCVTSLLNRSFSEGIVPSCFKEAIISPIQKRSRPSKPDDYRPISLLPIISKIAEKLVAAHWIKPFICDRMKTDQFAYVPGPGKGTTSALALMYHEILHYLDKESGAVRLLSVDFSRAFDKLPHFSIQQAAINFKLPKEAASWISDFLSNRRQRTRIGDNLSSWTPVTSGVPQGSVIGPLLFCMVLNSLSPLSSRSVMIKYADDVSVLTFSRIPTDDTLQAEWDNIVAWSDGVGLPINTSKCAVLNFVTKHSITLQPVCVDGERHLPTLSILKLLGVTISNDLRWTSHVNDVISKVSRRLFVLHFMKRSNAPPEVMLKVYNALLRPLMLYCYPVFCNAPRYLLRKLEMLESRALKLCKCDLKQASLLEMAEQMSTKLTSQIVQQTNHPLRQCFVERAITRRNTCPLRPPFARTKRLKTSFIRFM